MRIRLTACALAALASCRSSPDPLPPEREHAPYRVSPAAFRFEVELCDVPLERAEALGWPAHEVEATVALYIDEKGLRAQLGAGAWEARPAFVARPGERTALAARPSSPVPAWTDGLRLELGAREAFDWAPQELEYAIDWRTPEGRPLARSNGRTPVPAERDIVLVCLPPRTLARNAGSRAVLALLRVSGLPPEH